MRWGAPSPQNLLQSAGAEFACWQVHPQEGQGQGQGMINHTEAWTHGRKDPQCS